MTLDELRVKVAQKLGILAAGESLSADDDDVINSAFEAVQAQLHESNLADWAYSDEVPEQFVPPVVDMIAAELVDVFTLPEPRRSILRAEGLFGNAPVSPAERRLRKLVAGVNAETQIEHVYF